MVEGEDPGNQLPTVDAESKNNAKIPNSIYSVCVCAGGGGGGWEPTFNV